MEDAGVEVGFRSVFTDSVVKLLVAALVRAYDTACEHHVPDEGADEQTFGFNLYKFTVHQVCRAIETSDCGLSLAERRPRFRFRVGDYELACHSVGSSEHQNIETSFPGNDGAVGEMVEEQLWLTGVPKAQGVERARKLILAHLGDPEGGLRAVYLCVPGRLKHGKIVEWQYTLALWIVGTESAVGARDIAATEEVAAPVVRLKQADTAPQAREVPEEEVAAPVIRLLDEAEDEEER